MPNLTRTTNSHSTPDRRMNTKLANPLAQVLGPGLLLALLIARPAPAATQTQTISNLFYGWNAVWLEVEPRDTNGSLLTADQVFGAVNFSTNNGAIDIVVVQSLPVGTQEFQTDTNLYNQAGWIVWSTTNSVNSRAITVRGNQAYLLHISPPDSQTNGSPAGPLTVTGDVQFYRPHWTRGSYNLTGFSVIGSPTFASLLQAGAATPGPWTNSIAWLNPTSGNWESKNSTDTIQPGRAYWVQVPVNLVSVDYAGPVAVDFTGWQQGGLYFGATPPTLTVTNPVNNYSSLGLCPAELTFSSLEKTNTRNIIINKLSPADQDIQLFHVVRVPDQLAWMTDPNVGVLTTWTVTSLAAQQSTTVTLGMNRNWSANGNYREQLYRIDVPLNPGTNYHYLPVSAINPDVAPTNAPVNDPASFAGLWVGTVTANAVTSLTDTNRSVQPSLSRPQLRVLVHVDTNGAPVLLSHVMLMQTKTADPSVSPEQVLILDEAQIPYYEGIQERGGKKVGIRYETVAFDMPRDDSTNGQSATFLQLVANSTASYTNISQVTPADVSHYLAGQATRPPSLQEVYHDRWELTGAFGPGNTIGTATNAPLRLDAFHRTNPFRHAYHPQHGAGYDITRVLRFYLDPDYQTGSGRLTGTYEETTTGLSTVPLVSRGSIVLQRVSYVDHLQ